MVRRPNSPPPRVADWPPERTHAALKKQLAALGRLRSRNFREAENDEQEWRNLTRSVLIHGFGENSTNVLSFFQAENVGDYYMYKVEDYVHQNNFELRVKAFAPVLKSSIDELELMLPEAELTGAYETGDEYGFYRDLKVLVGFATKELFIVDNYLDTKLFDVYMENVDSAAGIRVLTNQVGPPLLTVAQMFSNRGNFELRSSKDVHDRIVFADDRCWVIGRSIKDAAKKKPTYIVEHPSAALMRGIYEPLWAVATVVVKK